MARSTVMGILPMVLMVGGTLALCYALISFSLLAKLLDIGNGCRMAFMYPSYVSHNEALRLHSRSSSPVMAKYSLFEYREAGVRHELNGKQAIPALFIPGNAGSYGQARSIASSAANQYWKSAVPVTGPIRDEVQEEWADSPGPVDWYTLDFNEDFSAFHGQTLRDQAFFVNEAVSYLQALYPALDDGILRGEEKNVTVLLVGHSMGGIVARLTQRLANYVPRSIDTILTLSTPHAYPPVPFDRSVDQVYDQVNEAWSLADEPEPLLMSIAGGVLDTQLSSDASSLSLARIQSPISRLSAYTSGLAMLWSSIDHLAVMWCDQLRFKVARGAMLDYRYYGRETEYRAQTTIRMERREMWRKLLGESNDAATQEERQIEATVAGKGDLRLRDLSPVMGRDTEGKEGVLMHQPGSEVLALFSAPGPRTSLDPMGNVDESQAFELLTNLCVGTNPNQGAPVLQPIELVVQLCSRSIEPSDPENLKKAFCRMVLPNAYETLPASPPPQDPTIESGRFPNASLLYEVPSLSIKRLHLSAEYLRENHVTFIRLERTLNAATFSGDNTLHRQTLLVTGWNEMQPIPLKGSPWLGKKTWHLPSVDPHQLLSSITSGVNKPLWQWIWNDIDSSLLAYELELRPAACALRFNYTIPPRTAPFIRVLNKATKDARIYPSLNVLQKARLPVALHGVAPFMPPALPEQQGTLLELWIPDNFQDTVYQGTYNRDCPLPFDKVSLRVKWRASAALHVLRYRFAILVWPVAVLALAHAEFYSSSVALPIDALCSLASTRTLSFLLGSPIAVQLIARVFQQLGIPGHWYAYGIGMIDLRYLPLGPVLMVIVYAMTLIVALLSELTLHTIHSTIKRFNPRWLEVLAVSPEFPQTSLVTFQEFLQWAKQRKTIITLSLLLACYIFLPFQILILAGFLTHCATMLGSYIAYRELQRIPIQMDENEAEIPPHETRRAKSLRALQSRYSQHTWLYLFLVFILPLQMPALVVWVRNVNVGVRMGLSRTQHSVGMSLALLVLVYMYASSSFYERPKNATYSTLTRSIYILLFLVSVIYGIRYAYVQYEMFQLVVAWEVVHRLYALYSKSMGSTHLRVDPSEPEREIFVLEPLQLALPRSLQSVTEDSVSAPTSEETREQSNSSANKGSTSRSPLIPVIHDQSDLPAKSKESDKIDEQDAIRALLDNALERYLATLESYLNTRRLTSLSLAQGFSQLARAKVALQGSFGLQVSEQLYDARMTAHAKFRDGHLHFGPDSKLTDTEVPTAKTVESRNTGLRNRFASSSSSTARPEDDSLKLCAAHSKPNGYDPLYQFSGLPPLSLRAAQSHFRDVLAGLLDTQHLSSRENHAESILKLQQNLEQLQVKIIEYRRILKR
ncbi:GPI inositol deacylase [Malassezia yamatoensis]|uniref:GPI inositol-deacylase n=1 Tax=Malassezia yamatoensis TaxID=253288 RepID=A0AAJ5YSZ7_9BASI|nr:GPI inositol deacylase [Malassezia yamatoensis]